MAGAQDHKRFSFRKKRVKQSNKTIGLLELQLPRRARLILKFLGAGNYASVVARMPDIKCSKQNVSYWKNKFLSMGALQLQTKDVFEVFRLTPFGQKLLTRSEGFVSEVVVLEDFAVKFGVLAGEVRRVDWSRLGCPRNWVKLGCRVGGLRVERTSGNVIIHPGRLRGFSGDEHELLMLSGRMVEWVKRVLEDRFGMVLSEDGVPLHEPIFRFYSKEAEEDVKYGTVITEGVGSTDQSPPEKRPHEEYIGVERAHARHLLPDTVKRIESKIDSLTGNVSVLATSVEKLLDALGKLTSPSTEKPLHEGEVERYVT